jgi:hypothetical protein
VLTVRSKILSVTCFGWFFFLPVRVQSEALTPIDDTATSGVGVASSRHVVPRQHQIGQQAAVINHYTASSHDAIRYHDNRTPVASSAAGSGSGSCRTSFTDRDVEMKDVSEFQSDEVRKLLLVETLNVGNSRTIVYYRESLDLLRGTKTTVYETPRLCLDDIMTHNDVCTWLWRNRTLQGTR